MTYIKRTFTRETTWECSSCGHENLGRFTDCQECKSPKEKDEKYKPSKPGAQEITDPELLRLAKAAPNRTCPYCHADVRDLNEACPSCGATRHEHQEAIGEYIPPEAVAPPAPMEPPEPTEAPPQPLPKQQTEPCPAKEEDDDSELKWPVKRRTPTIPPDTSVFRTNTIHKVIAIFGGALAIGLIVWMFVYFLCPWETTGNVGSVHWQYHVSLQQKTLRHDEDWQSGVRVGAFNVSCERRQHGTENCNAHECNCHNESYECNCSSYECNCHEDCSDNGNGFETCTESCSTCQRCNTCSREVCSTCYDQCPVYDQWCSYDWYDWPVVDQATSSGDDLNVYAPSLQAQGPDQRLIGSPTFDVTFGTPDGTWIHHPSTTQEFRRFTPGQWHVKVNRAGQIWPLRRLAD